MSSVTEVTSDRRGINCMSDCSRYMQTAILGGAQQLPQLLG
jgi:hypothetical protein